MATISIVLPTYNGEKYIRQSIDSILKQTYKDWELIIVDDCSSDSTAQIVEAYAGKDIRIKVLHNKKNRNLPVSLNIGFSCAKGEFLTWTSDDNLYMPNALEVMLEYFVKNPDAYMVCTAMQIIDGKNEIIFSEYDFYDEKTMYYSNSVGACFLYRKEVKNVVGDYDAMLFGVEDYDYWLRTIKIFGKIGHIKQPLYQYRTHCETLTEKKKNMIIKNLAILRNKHIDILNDNIENIGEGVSKIYFDFLHAGYQKGQIPIRIFELLPELSCDEPTDDNFKYIIFGAGDYGDKAFQCLGDRIAYYADNDLKKVGQYKNGKKILSFSEVVIQSKNYQILIAVSEEKSYQIMQQLYNQGIKKYCTYQMLDSFQTVLFNSSFR